MHRKIVLGLVALGLALVARGDVSLAPLFRDHAVVQRDQPLVVWGWADPGERVTVEFGGYSAAVATSPDGNWRVNLPAPVASAVPTEIRVQGRNSLVIRDVLIGDVWLASGQSNMEWRVDQAADAEKEIAAARHPLIRHFDVPNLVANEPRRTADGSWTICSPTTAANYSAVAYYFAREWHAASGVPVGIVNATWGGTPVEAWMSAATLASRETFKPALARWQQTLAEYPTKKAEYDAALARWEKADAAVVGKAQAAYRRENPKPRAPRGPGHHWTPAGLYNGMIAPLVPFPLAGAIWYQAESNADYPGDYAPLFTAMIQQWRAEWGREFPFYFVQIANFQGTATDRKPGQWAWLREAQTQALALPKTGMAVTIDIGTPRNIHPKNKQEVGRRLALLARRDLLGAKEEASGPVLKEAIAVPGGFRLVFDHADGLQSSGTPLTGFEVAGADQQFFPAAARIDRGAVIVTSAQVPQPVTVRYAWANAPEARLQNAANLPAAPFRTDRWPQP